jgi:predicted AAA+ superfamily ATPase
LLTIVAEWLEKTELPLLALRNQPAPDIESLTRIPAIVGPRRAGKTYYMDQLIQSLLQSRNYKKEDTYAQEEERTVNGFAISVEPVWKWLLGAET